MAVMLIRRMDSVVMPGSRSQAPTDRITPLLSTGLTVSRAAIAGLEAELRAVPVSDPGMTLLTAVEYITPGPGRRIALYRRCSAEDQGISGMRQDDARFSRSLHQ